MVQILYAIFAEASWLCIGFGVGFFGVVVGGGIFRPMVKGRENGGAVMMLVFLTAPVCALISASVAAFHLGSPMSTRLNVCGTVNATTLLATIVFAVFKG